MHFTTKPYYITVLVVFNYLFSNGDAHLKNFSLLESPNKDYLLSPAYDLINTRIHLDDTDFALDRELFKDSFKSDAYKKFNHVSKEDFIELAKRMEIMESRMEKLLAPFLEKQALLEELIGRSFLDKKTKRAYILDYNTRRNYLNK